MTITAAARRAPADARPAPHSPRGAGAARRLTGLDGLRAVAIVAVLLFHLNPAWLPGGFIGVDVFFVVSGFLITTLLVREQAATGAVDLRGFWGRRARRLLPALLLVVPLSVLLARVTEADLLVGVGAQVFGALTFSFNWVQIAAGADYFDATSAQLFMNFWSLAVEEQFYLAWPLLAGALIAAVRSTRVRVAVALALAGASAAAMALSFDPEAGATRVYYGTDTHVFGLMLGSGLAFWYAGPGADVLSGAAWARRRRAVTIAALTVLAALLWWLDESRPVTFRGGMVLASIVSAVLVAAAVSGGGLTRVLELPPLRWLGERSYGIYLWHWPVILIVNADLGGVAGSQGFLRSRVWCVLVILALADLSYRLVELPVRRHGWRVAWALWAGWVPGARGGRRVLAGIASAVVAACVLVVATAPAQSSTQRVIEANASAATRPPPVKPAVTNTPAPARSRVLTMPKSREIDAYGDSMMVGSVPALKYYFPSIRIDATSNRRWSAGYRTVVASGTDIRRGVVLSFGTNAGVVERDVRATLERLGPARMVVLLTVHLNQARARADNAALRRVVADYPNAILADWNAAVSADPSLLQPDGIHPSMTGQHTYAALVRQGFADLVLRHTGTKVTLTPKPIP